MKEKVRTILRNSSLISETENGFNCMYSTQQLEELKKNLPHTSSHNYTPEMIDIIRQFENGLILDCGAGSRETKYDNVVNLEIFPYPGTNVISKGNDLPFYDNTFDAIFSLAVLEHVQEPALVMSEMQRVLKPEGILWVDAAFMQPYHGFPHHYFNMTQTGLESLLNSNMKIIKSFTPSYGTPIWSLTWFLTKYAAHLPEDTKEEFLNLKISDLTKHASYLLDESFVSDLSKQGQEQLAATVSVIAQKIT